MRLNLALIVAQALLAFACHAVLITDLDQNGRDGGYYSLYRMEFQGEVPILSRFTCYTDRLKGDAIETVTCQPSPQQVPLRNLFRAMAPNLDDVIFTEAMLQAQKQSTAALKSEDVEFLDAYFGHKLDDLGLSFLFQKAMKGNKEQTHQNHELNSFLNGYKDSLNLVQLVKEEDKHYFLSKNTAHHSENYRALIQWQKYFQVAHHQTVGTTCIKEIPGILTNAGGGCQLISAEIVYSNSEYRNDRFQNDFWINRDLALHRCRTLTAGGHYDWRLPTEGELLKASKHAQEIGFDPFLFYWTSELYDNTFVERKTYRLGEEIVDKKTYPTLIGISISIYGGNVEFKPSFADAVSSIVNTDRTLKGDFQVEATHYKLVRPEFEQRFEIIRHRLMKATGMLYYQQQLRYSTPGIVGYERSQYWDGAQVYEPKVYSRNEYLLSSNAHSESVNPLDYVAYELPNDVLKNKIGLLCVRNHASK